MKTKSGVTTSLIHLGFSQSEGPFPPSLVDVQPSESFTSEEMEFARYIAEDTDFGGAWNDAEQIDIHCRPTKTK